MAFAFAVDAELNVPVVASGSVYSVKPDHDRPIRLPCLGLHIDYLPPSWVLDCIEGVVVDQLLSS